MTSTKKYPAKFAYLPAGFVALVLMSCSDSTHPVAPDNGTPASTITESVSDSMPVGTPLSLVSASTTHEPSGYVRFAENDLKSLPGGLWVRTSLLGCWSWPYAGDPDLTIATASTGPRSPSPFMSTRFPTGLVAGRAPVIFGGWEGRKAHKSKVYMSVWIRIRGNSYENQASGTKFGFLSYGDDESNRQNQGFLILNGRSTQGIFSSFTFKFVQTKHVVSNRHQNVNTGALFTAGPWHQLETIYEVNTIGKADGKLRMWVDGIQIMNYTDMVYITAAKPVKFNYWNWNPTWGGMTGVRTRTDYIDIDHVYMSGLP